MIRVENLGKRYKRYPSRWARLAEWVSGSRYIAHEDALGAARRQLRRRRRRGGRHRRAATAPARARC